MHVNYSQINSSKKCGFESHDRTKGFHRKTARQNRPQTNNHHLRQSFIWQLSLCGNYTLIFDPENAPNCDRLRRQRRFHIKKALKDVKRGIKYSDTYYTTAHSFWTYDLKKKENRSIFQISCG